jgi:hypothetical protein
MTHDSRIVRKRVASRRAVTAGRAVTLAPPVGADQERGVGLAAREEAVVHADDVVLEAEAVEESQPEGAEELPQPRRLPDRSRRADVEAWRGEMQRAAIAAAGGLVAGAATVAAVRAVRGATQARRQRSRRVLGRRPEQTSIVASRSFLIDVHILGGDR